MPKKKSPKYIFKKNEYTQFEKKDYIDQVLTEYTGRKYKLNQIRWFHLPGEKIVAEKYGYSLGINVGVNSIGPGGFYEAHKHKSPSFYFVLSGKAKVKVGDEEKVVGPATWIVTPPGINHYVETIGKKPFTYITCDTLNLD
ncbi:MAG: cupin domain-containing protein [Thaumarchaeota archaeon]|nr:cupin domain-containing protein [Nitrososphaerota archaeon]